MKFNLDLQERGLLLTCIQQSIDLCVGPVAAARVGVTPAKRADAIRLREELEALKTKLAAGATLTVDLPERTQ